MKDTGTYIDKIGADELIEVQSGEYIAYGYSDHFMGEKLYNANVFRIADGKKKFISHATLGKKPTEESLLNYIEFVKEYIKK